MDLKIQGKIVIITKDVGGFCNQVFKLLRTEGAIPIIVNTSAFVDLKKQIKDNSDLVINNMDIDAFVNISDSEKAIHHDDILMYFYQHPELSNRLASNFSIINIGTRDALSITGDSYQNSVIDYDYKKSSYENFFQYKVNTIVHPEIPNKIKSMDVNQTSVTVENKSISTKIHVANTITMLISRMFENIKNQTIFIDKGEHLFQN